MDNLFEELGISTKYIKSTSQDHRFIVLVQRIWLKTLFQDAKLLSDISKRMHIEHWTYDSVEPGPSWQKIFVSVYRKRSDCKVLPLPRIKITNNQAKSSLIFAQLMELVAEANHKNLWKDAYKKYNSKSDRENASATNNVVLVDYNDVLRDVIFRTYGCPIIYTCYEPSIPSTHTQFDPHPNILPVICAVETLNAIFLIHSPFVEHNLNDCVTFSEAILSQCYTKPLFIIYQLLHAMRMMHDRSLTLGEIRLQDIYLTKDLWIMVFPQLLSNIHVLELPEKSNIQQQTESDGCKLETYGVKTKNPTFNNECLEVLCERWLNGGMSNFDYLMALNHLSGRRTGNPNCHPVFPWVTDFSSRCGKSWRDLRKSKFRLNKGDCHLDLTYNNHQSVPHLPSTSSPTQTTTSSVTIDATPLPPHHVSDILSPITYYVYMARRTPRPLLTKHVRPVWVPAEYPASIQRLHAWTPDECVPEFYCDATVFRSVHADLDDLEVPSWAASAEEFVHRHREMLESAKVSERLHWWIDLTFGYKLSGVAAVKAKNVCLNLVDGHSNLTCSGIVQLFAHPHPARISPSPFFGKIPTKKYFHSEKKTKSKDHSSSSTAIETSRSEEDIEDDSSSNHRSPLVLSRLKSRSRSSLNESDKLDQHKLSRSPSTGRSLSLGPKNSTLNAYSKSSSSKSTSGLISLPGEYNPAQALINLENKHVFMSSTFHTSDNKKYTFTKDNANSNSIITDDINEDLDLLQNAFTNQFFESKLQYTTKKSFTFPIDGIPSKEYFRRSRSRTSTKNDQRISCNYAEIIASRRVKELQILGCLITEIFLNKQLRPMGNTASTNKSLFNARLKVCLTILRSYETLVPLCIKHILNLLLQPNILDLDTVKFPAVSDIGLPPPSAHLLLEPLLHMLIPFPKHFPKLYALVKRSKDFGMVSQELNLIFYVNCDGKNCAEYEKIEQEKAALAQNIAECQVKRFALDLEQLLSNDAAYIWQEEVQIARLVTPYLRELIDVKESAVLAVWFLFDPIARVLGPEESATHLLLPLLNLYNPVPNTNHTPVKIAKIYHHSFLLRVIVRLGLRCFLEHFITPFVEAVGGCRDNCRKNSSTNRYVNHCCAQASNSSVVPTEGLFSGDKRGSGGKQLLRIVDDIPIVEGEVCSDGGSSSDDGKRVGDHEEVFQLEEETEGASIPIPFEHTKHHHCRSITAESALDASISANIQHLRDLELDLDAGQLHSTQVNAATGITQVISPTIPIPGNGKGFNKVGEVGDIQCEYGSKMGNMESMIEEDGYEVRKQATELIEPRPVSSSSTITSSHSAQISDISSDSLGWLAHRLGPVLTARYLSRNLLKMLTLCYVGADNLKLLEEDGHCSEHVGDSVTRCKVVGDRCAEKVLECLANIAALYGEQIILLQYLPHMSELVTLCKRKLTLNLEGSLISCLALLQYIIPYLSDATLMDQVQDIILKNILHPCIRLLGSTKYSFPNGALARNVVARKYVHTLYILSLRMGADNTRTLLAVPALQRFFLIFDKINDSGYYGQATIQRDVLESIDTKESLQKSIEESHFVELRRDGTTKEWAIGGRPVQISHVRLRDTDDSTDSLSPPINFQPSTSAGCGIFDDSILNQAIEELQMVFTPALAHMAYVPFLQQIGQPALEQALKNHSTIHNLCVEHEKNNTETNKEPPSNPQLCTTLSTASSATITLIGNRISVRLQEQDIAAESLLTTRMANTTRHLRGNWLAYWEHEIGRSEKDDGVFDFKQIKLQTFSGHGNAVRAICGVDNENSFLSGSRDKTIKLWSLRSAGDGTASVPCQWTYTGHRKSVLSVAFLQAVRLVSSCDSTGSLHIWDPYLGGVVGQLDGTLRQINVVKAFPAPSTSLLAATTEGSIRIIDIRQCSFVQDLKISMNPMGIIRCLAISPSGAYIAVGQNSGQVTVLDGRTGLIIASWRAHEGEVLQLAFVRETHLVSTSLDQMIACWNIMDGNIMFYMKGPSEPVHCINFYGDSLISGNTANRIGVHNSVSSEATYTGIKLRADIIREYAIFIRPVCKSLNALLETAIKILNLPRAIFIHTFVMIIGSST